MPSAIGNRARRLNVAGPLLTATCIGACLPWVAVHAERIEVVATGITDNTFVGSGDPCGTGLSGGNACNNMTIVIRLTIDTSAVEADQFAEVNHGWFRRSQAPGFVTGYATIRADSNAPIHEFRMPGTFTYNFDQLVETFDDIDGSAYGFTTLDRVQFGIGGGNALENFQVSPNFIMTGNAFTGDSLDVVGEVVGSPLAVVNTFRLSNGAFSFTNASGQVQGQYRIHSASFRFVLPDEPRGLADVNGDGTRDVAVLRGAGGTVEMRSGATGAPLGNLAFLGSSFRLITAVVLPDTDGNGVAEIGVLARRKSDLRTVVEIRNVSGAQAARQVWFEPNRQPVDLAVITDDADGNGVLELAVLSRRTSDGRGVVEVRNAFGTANAVSVWLGTGLIPQDLEIVPDADSNGVPEVAVLASRSSDGRALVEVKNAAGAAAGTIIWCASGNAAVNLAVSADSDGNSIPELAVLLERRSDRRGVVEVRNAAGAYNTRMLWLAAGNVGLAVEPIGDADGNTVPDVAVLARRDSDGRALVEVKNTSGAVNTNTLWYPAGYTATQLAVLEDVDANGVREAAPLLVRDSDGRLVMQRRNASGAQAPRDYWFSP